MGLFVCFGKVEVFFPSNFGSWSYLKNTYCLSNGTRTLRLEEEATYYAHLQYYYAFVILLEWNLCTEALDFSPTSSDTTQ
jgi:hypothetical protein